MLSYEIDERRNHLIGCFLNEVRTFEILKDTFDMFKVENLDKINVKIRTDNGDKNITVQSKKMGNENPFSIDIQNETLVFKARACSNRDCFSAIMSEIENNYKSNKFNKIVYDIRDNRGGSNAVMKPFHEFLKEHNLPYVAIVNNGTFSAGVWEAFACKKDYAKVIGDKIGQPMCRYGNCFKHYDNEMFSVYCSTQLYEINSSTSKNFVDSNRLVLDIEVSNSIKDLNDGKDLQLETAIKEVEKEYNSIKF